MGFKFSEWWYWWLIVVVLSYNNEAARSPNVCGTQTSCIDCLLVHKDCAWCSKWDNKLQIKCNLKENLLEAGCEEEYIQVGGKGVINILKNEKFQDTTDTREPVQFKPQYFDIKLRPNEESKIKIQIRPSRNYPLDLYFLVDVSHSMEDDVKTIKRVGQELINSLRELTTNYRLGFGVFSDKPLLPWIQVDPEHLKNPCITQGKQCQPPFDFKHILALTNDSKKFMRQFDNPDDLFTANLDNVDGGLDALMQVVVCWNEMGWSNKARRIVILASDSLFHVAGDGKLAGIIRPNDRKCHLNRDGYYTGETEYDYPSVGQIHKVIYDNKINVVFAVTENIKPIYDQLNLLIPKFSYVARLESDSSNILHLVRQGYEDITSRLHLQDNSTLPVQITYRSKCGALKKLNETSMCPNVTIGSVYEFELALKATEWPKDKSKRKQRIIIEEANIGVENIVLDVEILFGCECEEQAVMNSTRCSNHGNEVCGLCNCDKNWLGKYCQCDSVTAETSIELQDKCRKPGSMWKCSNKGECICGICQCDRGWSGEYCDCQDCDLTGENQRCNNHGVCECGRCICEPEYTGFNCGCSKDDSSCKQTPDGKVCSGHGHCSCGRCECHKVLNMEYIGRFCETEFNKDCSRFHQCVSAVIAKDDDLADALCQAESVHNITRRDVIDNDESLCTFMNESVIDANVKKCYNRFKYSPKQFDDRVTFYLDVFPQDCSESYLALTNIWKVLVALFIAWIIAMVAIKVRNWRLDRIEYLKFEEMVLGEKREVNPLYISPKTYHEVPKELRNLE